MGVFAHSPGLCLNTVTGLLPSNQIQPEVGASVKLFKKLQKISFTLSVNIELYRNVNLNLENNIFFYFNKLNGDVVRMVICLNRCFAR